jgi:hypothetical protein
MYSQSVEVFNSKCIFFGYYKTNETVRLYSLTFDFADIFRLTHDKWLYNPLSARLMKSPIKRTSFVPY